MAKIFIAGTSAVQHAGKRFVSDGSERGLNDETAGRQVCKLHMGIDSPPAEIPPA
ncbi:Uncharacterized protein dnm_007540 [Desulfonema magnum]|uniref:Uncharacterized protein n=1 Tax=Desulfonema magnum TaxID=45655 RepID=A0A975BFF0_9BACT|nr:Uncharacterized protein dnm_007540 [Desulfonema magnum]